jgi:CrcB protein
MQLSILLSVGLGGFIGALLRYYLSTVIQKALPATTFPFGTLSVNVIGSFIIGILVLYFEEHLAPHQKAFFIVGVLGSLTTFSTFSLQTVEMLYMGHYARGLANIVLNVAVTCMAVMAGMLLYRKVFVSV